MSSLIGEIRNDVIRNNEPISSILRKAKLLANKLGNDDLGKWVNFELEGYPDMESLPKYRIISGSLKAWNPYLGYIPIDFRNPKKAETFSSKPIYDSIIQIENVCKEQDGTGEIESPIPNPIKMELLKITNGMEPTFLLNKGQFFAIVENVKNVILDWMLKLETEGISSDSLNFTEKEKEKASSIVVNISQMNNSQIQLDTINSIQNFHSNGIDENKIKEFIKAIEDNLNGLSLSEESFLEIKTDIKTIITQLESPKPKNKILIETLHSIRNVLEGATGSIIASGLLYKLHLFVPQ